MFTRELTIWCDGDSCVEWTQFSGMTVAQARAELTRSGWHCTPSGDRCRDCVKEDARVALRNVVGRFSERGSDDTQRSHRRSLPQPDRK